MTSPVGAKISNPRPLLAYEKGPALYLTDDDRAFPLPLTYLGRPLTFFHLAKLYRKFAAASGLTSLHANKRPPRSSV